MIGAPEQINMDDVLYSDMRHTAENDPTKFRDLTRSFRDFHSANPGVYDVVVRMARRAKAAGHNHIGIATLWELARWEVIVGDTKLGQGYKLNNNHRAFYARLIMEQEPDLAEMFETRRQRAVE